MRTVIVVTSERSTKLLPTLKVNDFLPHQSNGAWALDISGDVVERLGSIAIEKDTRLLVNLPCRAVS